jgi:diguanylate cyclase (GGDEF)-like protein/PAS domain S-box-containing protein
VTQEFHSLLRRQLRRHGLELDSLPDGLRALLDSVSQAYQESDEDRLMVERSLELSSQELFSSNAEIRQSEERFRSLVQNASDLIVIVNAEGRVTYASPSVTQIMGYEDADWQTLDVPSIIHPDHLEEAAQSLRAVIEEPGVHPPTELLIRHRDGSYRCIEMIAQNLLGVPAVDGVVYNARDITERKVAEDALRGSEERFRRLAENSPVGIYQLSPERRPIYMNPALLRALEADSFDEIAERPFESLFSAESLETLRLHQAMRAEGRASTYEVELIGLSGTKRSVLVSGAAVYDSSGGPLSSLGTVIDITDRKLAERALQTSEERFRAFAENSADGVLMVDEDGNIVMANAAAERMFGYTRVDLVGQPLEMLVPESLRAAHRQYRASFHSQAHAARPMAGRGDLKARRGDASEFPAEISLIPLPAPGAHLMAAVIRDVTERRNLENQLRHQAFHDPLTGLANRARLGDRLEHALERAGRQTANVALIFMDVDNFKSINDGLGHSVGDIALQHVAKRLQMCLRPGDTAARLGGDEFAILLEDSTIDDAVRMSEDILTSLTTPLTIDEEDIIVRASIGIAGSEVSAYDADGLLRNADIAMYAAKDAGKARYQVYRPSMRVALLERLTLLRDMERAVERREFFVEYQPLIDLETTAIVGFEALVRWNHPRLGRLPPADFIGLAEESGLIIPLGLQVLEESCAQARRWQDDYPHDPPRTMSVNVSVKQLEQKDFLESLLRVLGEAELDPSSLVLEVTESVMLQDTQSAVALLQAIRSYGVKVAIDDFGTGYSSLSYLSRFPFDVLKIDKSFVDQTRGSGEEGVLARAIIDIGRMFAVEVVAEGIEDQGELERLRDFNCKIGQGFLFAKPAGSQQIGEMLRRATDSAKAA